MATVTLGDLQATFSSIEAFMGSDPILARIWKESIERQKNADAVKRKAIIEMLLKSIDDHIDTLKECRMVLESIKGEQDTNVRLMGLDILKEKYESLERAVEGYLILVDELEEVIR
jgi:hypothetical protein